MSNPLKTIWNYYERSGVRRDLPVLKRMFVEAPHVPIGTAVAVGSCIVVYVYLNHFYDFGIGYQLKYTVLRPDDPKIPKFRSEVINADKIASS